MNLKFGNQLTTSHGQMKVTFEKACTTCIYKYDHLLNLDQGNSDRDQQNSPYGADEENYSEIFSTTTTSITTNNPDKPPTQYADVYEYSGDVPVTSGVGGHEYQYIDMADRTVNQTSTQVRKYPRHFFYLFEGGLEK